MKISGVNLLSGLANNNDSLLPMMVKDAVSNGTIVYTYAKEGGKDDAREKFIEEYGTGVAWLLSIPFIKKVFDSTVYKKLNLNPDFDERLILSNKDIENNAKGQKTGFLANLKDKLFSVGVDKESALALQKDILAENNDVYTAEKQVFATLNDKNDVLKNIPFLKNLTNGQLYKSLFMAKFVTATALSAALLVKIIKLKQQTTEKRIQRDIQKNHASNVMLNKAISQNQTFQSFLGNGKNEEEKPKEKEISFKGGYQVLSAFAHNPILNNTILDGVISLTRLKEARKGEKKEIALKEAFQIVFIYALAKPTQKLLEYFGDKFKKPVALDPKVLFDKNLEQNLPEILKEAKDVSKDGSLVQNVYNFAKANPKSPFIDALAKNGAINLITKEGETKGISYLKPVSEDNIKTAISELEKLNGALKENSSLKSIKAYKVFSVFANLAFGIWAMGVLQPKVAIFMRKMLNNGDNRNPAIVAQEQEMLEKHKANLA